MTALQSSLVQRLLPAGLRTFFGGSIRRRLSWAFGLLLLGLLGLAASLFYVHQRDFLYEQGERQASNLAYSLAVSSASWLVARDLAGLQEVTSGFASTPDLKFAAVLSRRGEVLASTRSEQVGYFFTDALSQQLLAAAARTQLLVSTPELIDVAAPIMSGNRQVGWARVEMTQDAANRHLRELVAAGWLFAAGAAIVVAAVAVLLARGLTRRLHQLVQLAQGVEQGQTDARTPLAGPDEIGALARGFNHMLDALAAQQAKLAERNAELALYNQVLQAIGRGATPQAVAGELAAGVQILIPGLRCGVWLREEDRLRLLPGSTLPHDRPELTAALDAASSLRTEARAARLAQPVLTGDTLGDAAWQLLAGLARRSELRACWAQPLLDGQHRVLGVFALYPRQPGEPDAQQAELMARCAGLASLAIERQRQQADLRIAATAFETQEVVVLLSLQRRFLRVNRAFTAAFGYEAAEVLGRSIALVRTDRQPDSFFVEVWRSVEQTGQWRGEVWYRRKDGSEFPAWVSITTVRDENGQPTHYVADLLDITAQKAAAEEIRQLAYFDPLTELPNRRLLLEQLRHALAASRRSHRHGALLFVDLDDFKAINDTLGHDRGDALLRQVAQRLSNRLRSQVP